MPKSRSRQKPKPRQAAKRYQLEPDRKRPPKESPRWYGYVVLGVMALGVVAIVGNYMDLLPGSPTNAYLWGGLGLIALGFLGTTRWR
jgi:cell division protein CrgA